MQDASRFGLEVAVVAVALMLAVLSNRFSDRSGIPAPALFLVAAALVSAFTHGADRLPVSTVQRIVTVALILILFDGGMHIGWPGFRANAAAIVWLGVAGTLVTAAVLAVGAHVLFGLDWRLAALVATALSPTDPAVVFSVLGGREIAGRSGVLLEGESGANDPVGISLMLVLLATHGGLGAGPVLHGLGEFALQMGVGVLFGVAGGRALLWFSRHLALPAEGLYPLRSLAGAGVIFGAATVAHGSGFLAVFLAGIVLGDENAPYKREIERFHTALASLGEIVAFALLGLTVDLGSIARGDTIAVGLGLALLMALVARPVFVGLVTAPLRVARNERAFLLWAGLKGAVPILLGTFVLSSGEPGAARGYDLIIVVVAFSVLVQAGLVPTAGRLLRLPIRAIHLEPWALGMRFRDEPSGLRRYVVEKGTPADGSPICDLPLHEDAWISFVSRDGALVHVHGRTVLAAGDEVLVLVDTDAGPSTDYVFRAGV